MRWPTSPSSVAENSIVWVRPVQWRRIHSTCGVNPSSAMRSASSSTTTSTSASETSFDLSRSINRSGVATTISTPSCRASTWCVPAGPAVHGEDPLTGVLGDRFEHLGDLHGELPRRHEHEAARAGRLGAVEDAGEHRDTEGERLARARAGPAAHVAALHRHGDGSGLDLERLGEPGGGESIVDVRRDAELGEAGRRLDGRQRGDGGERRGARSVVSIGGAARTAPAAGRAPPGGRISHDSTRLAGQAFGPREGVDRRCVGHTGGDEGGGLGRATRRAGAWRRARCLRPVVRTAQRDAPVASPGLRSATRPMSTTSWPKRSPRCSARFSAGTDPPQGFIGYLVSTVRHEAFRANRRAARPSGR